MSRTALSIRLQTQNREAVYAWLVGMKKNLHPLSATGGWFSTIYIAKMVRMQEGTVRNHLQLLHLEGLVDKSDDKVGRGRSGTLWRAR